MRILKNETAVQTGQSIKPTQKEFSRYLKKLSPGWHVVNDREIKRSFSFKTLEEEFDFINKIAYVAEKTGHRPAMCIKNYMLEVTLLTPAVEGLSEKDFQMAQKIDEMSLAA